MLEERDRRALADIEQRLAVEDPDFVRRMDGAVRLPLIPVLCMTVFLTLPFVALFLGPAAALITVDLTALLVILLLAVRRARRRR
ncbi:DUF3040 domain-containing protein [Actinoplanes derwentensis]|uniref:DUF3040 domain-containing protein n=1 Tax=Actinoplanes derwentensis TaxID=113562 RepID=A0A1H1RHN7_9ACTN|nr:DUF3040 domain-containing protein [Actinoplanes derwentensis]GID84427.1 hypothetical protein Ade03nite_33510 [Actinoplanes derwentensis]SDS35251.1 Protein of unknown function [Actinoplanes derwentensis]